MKNLIRLVCVSIAILFSSTSCEYDGLDVTNPNQLGAKAFYSNIDNLNSSLTSVYEAQAARDTYAFNLYPFVLYSLAKTADNAFTANGERNQIFTNNITPTNGIVSTIWRGFYTTVARANDFLEGSELYLNSDNAREGDEEIVREMQAQALLIRAHSYFHLIRLWGEANPTDDLSANGVPLITEVATDRENMNVKRASVGEVYNQIVKDLQTAEMNLPDSWNTANIGRVTSYAASTLLGQVYLYMEDYENALSKFERVVNGPYSLVSFNNVSSMFDGSMEFSSESIFEINYAQASERLDNRFNGGAGMVMSTVIAPNPGLGFKNEFPHDENIRRFGNDPRIKTAALEPGVDSLLNRNEKYVFVEPYTQNADILGWSFHKYVAQDHLLVFNDNGANIVVSRLADVYLMYAEALNATGQDGMALQYLNMVRERSYENSPDSGTLSGISGNQLRDAIREERFLELFAEGHRWYDIRRWKIADTELAKYNTTLVGEINFNGTSDYYLPIPQDELDRNTAIVQSTGY